MYNRADMISYLLSGVCIVQEAVQGEGAQDSIHRLCPLLVQRENNKEYEEVDDKGNNTVQVSIITQSSTIGDT